MSSLALADIVVIALYLLGMLAVGYLASRRINNSTDYAVAGRSMGFPVLCGTLIGTTVGAAATMGNAGKAYQAGFAVLYVSLAYVLGYILMGFIAPRLRAMQIDSLPDVLQRRYGAPMRVTGAVVLLMVAIPVVAVQLTAAGLIVTRFLPELGVGFSEAVIISAFVIVVYTLLGGLLAVAYTDLLQVGIMLLGIGVCLPVILASELGSVAAVQAALVPPAAGWLGGLELSYVLSFFPIFTCMVLIDPSVWQRIAAAKNPQQIRPAMFLTAGFFGAWSILVVGLGVVAFNLYPDLAPADIAIPQMVVDYMPPVIKGLCIAAIIALIMSTGDSMLLISGTTASWDILRTLRPHTPDRILLRVSRVVIVLVGLLGVVIALAQLPLFAINFTALGIFVCGLFIPLMGALFMGRVSGAAAILATLVGASSVAGLQIAQFGFGVEPVVQPMLLGLGLSAATYLLVSAVVFATTRPGQ